MQIYTARTGWLLILLLVLTLTDLTAAPKKYFFIGNSLTAGIGLVRLGWLAAQHNDPIGYGSQMQGNCKLPEHWQMMREYGTAWSTGKDINGQTAVYGDYPDALQNFQWDAVVLQPYMMWIETGDSTPNTYGYKAYGDRYSCDRFIDYARGNNPKHNTATQQFYIYGAWPNVLGIHYRNPGRPAGTLDTVAPDYGNTFTGFTFENFYNLPYDSSGGGQWHDPRQTTPNTDHLRRLVDSLNTDNPGLPVPVRLIPAGAVLARLDSLIRQNALPGIEAHFIRHAGYYDTARFVGQQQSQYNAVPRSRGPFDRTYGVMNFYADLIHMNDQSHSAPAHGTIGAYVAGVTVYTVLTGRDPRGTPVSVPGLGWYRLDPALDAALIAAVQQAVWDVVTSEPRTGVSGSTAVRSAAGQHTIAPRLMASRVLVIDRLADQPGVYDVNGKSVTVPFRQRGNKMQADVTRLMPGIYCVTGANGAIIKFIKY